MSIIVSLTGSLYPLGYARAKEWKNQLKQNGRCLFSAIYTPGFFFSIVVPEFSRNFFSSRASSFPLEQPLFLSSNFFSSQNPSVSNLLVRMLGTNATLVHYTKSLTHYTPILSSKPCVNSADTTIHAATLLQARTQLGSLRPLVTVLLLYSIITGTCSASSWAWSNRKTNVEARHEAS